MHGISHHISRLRICVIGAALLATVAVIFATACGSGSSSSSSQPSMGTVSTSISDPATCSAPEGPFSHVYVTVTDVQINQSSTAGDNDSSWVDLTPSLKSAPQQLDLFGVANSSCFLAMLGSNTEIQAGTYQQVRVILAANSTQIANNQCKSSANCVVLASSPNSPQPLQLSSESTTGIKIPSGQIAGGQFTVGVGQTKDLNVDFNACASIVVEPNGQYRLKPVLHAGEVTATSTSINGSVVDNASNQPIAGTVLVALEQKDSAGVDRVVMETKADGSGNFVFCPVPSGSYDVVAVGVSTSGVSYAATLTMGLQPGNSAGKIPLIAVNSANTADATITGSVSSANGSSAGTAADVAISALQQITAGSALLQFTVPLVPQTSSSVNITTAAGSTCPTNTDCATYSIGVPAAEPNVGSFTDGSTTTYSQSTGVAAYEISAFAFVPSAGGTADCSPSAQTVTNNNAGTALTVVPATTSTAQSIAFTGCQ